MKLARRWNESVPVDIAPMIDVVFQMLIYFMLSSSFIIHPGIRVTLPKAATGKTLSTSQVVITLTKDHLIYLDEDLVTLKDLQQRLKTTSNKKPVLIKADRHAYVEKLIQLWDTCRDANYTEIHIATMSE